MTILIITRQKLWSPKEACFWKLVTCVNLFLPISNVKIFKLCGFLYQILIFDNKINRKKDSSKRLAILLLLSFVNLWWIWVVLLRTKRISFSFSNASSLMTTLIWEGTNYFSSAHTFLLTIEVEKAKVKLYSSNRNITYNVRQKVRTGVCTNLITKWRFTSSKIT